MEGFSFFVAGGDFTRIIVYNVVYFFHDYYVYINLVFIIVFIHVISLLVSVVIKHLSLTLLNSVKGVTIQRWHDWHPLGGRKTLWFAWLDAPIPVEGWACGWVAARELVKTIGWFDLECWELIFLLNPDDFFREKCCWGSCWWDLGLGFNVGVGHLWLRLDSLARCKPDRGMGSISSLPRVPSLTNGMTKRTKWDREKKETRNRNKILITFLLGGSECIPGWF